MTADANVTSPDSPVGDLTDEHPAASSTQQRTWSTPKPPITRKQADAIRRFAATAITGFARFVAAGVRRGARAVRQIWHVIDAVPAAAQLCGLAGIGMLLGVVGAITLHTTVGLICIVVVVPVSAGILGALGHRWYSGLDLEVTRQRPQAEPTTSDLQRSVQYVDRKLAAALTSFGTDNHQQAVIALFQAKTAVELTLGTEQDPTSHVDLALRAGDYALRPRIRAGSTSAPPESNSVAAS